MSSSPWSDRHEDRVPEPPTGSQFVLERAGQRAVVAEVGAWSNPLSPDETTRTAAVELCKRRLALADRVGARCCVNIAGSRSENWDVTVQSWVRADRSHLDLPLADAVARWLASDWPWVMPVAAPE